MTDPTTQAYTRATPDSTATPNSTPSVGAAGSGSIIYAAVGVGGAVCILFIVVIIVTAVICAIR